MTRIVVEVMKMETAVDIELEADSEWLEVQQIVFDHFWYVWGEKTTMGVHGDPRHVCFYNTVQGREITTVEDLIGCGSVYAKFVVSHP